MADNCYEWTTETNKGVSFQGNSFSLPVTRDGSRDFGPLYTSFRYGNMLTDSADEISFRTIIYVN